MKYATLKDNILAVINRNGGSMTRTELLPLLRHVAQAKEMHAALDEMITQGYVEPHTVEVEITRTRKVPAIRVSASATATATTTATTNRISRKATEAVDVDSLLS